jgi:chromate reductase
MNILTISGSLRATSSNSAVLDAVALLAPPDLRIVRYEGLGTLPHFNPDLDADNPPKPVLELRRLVGEAQGIIFSSPEYAHGIAGSFKNGLDWLVRSLEFPGKPVVLINAAPRASHAEQQTLEILRTISAQLVDEAMLTLPVQGSRLDARGIADTEALATPLKAMLRRFADAIDAADRAQA